VDFKPREIVSLLLDDEGKIGMKERMVLCWLICSLCHD
jgi:hypothetical protein